MNNEVKPNTAAKETIDSKASNTRALVIVGVFIALFVGIIIFEVVSKK